MDYLIIPATSTESERMFSQAGILLNPRKSRTGREKVNMFVKLHKNVTEDDLF